MRQHQIINVTGHPIHQPVMVFWAGHDHRSHLTRGVGGGGLVQKDQQCAVGRVVPVLVGGEEFGVVFRCPAGGDLSLIHI